MLSPTKTRKALQLVGCLGPGLSLLYLGAAPQAGFLLEAVTCLTFALGFLGCQVGLVGVEGGWLQQNYWSAVGCDAATCLIYVWDCRTVASPARVACAPDSNSTGPPRSLVPYVIAYGFHSMPRYHSKPAVPSAGMQTHDYAAEHPASCTSCTHHP